MIKTIDFYQAYDGTIVTAQQAQQAYWNSVINFIRDGVLRLTSKVPFLTRTQVTQSSYIQDTYTFTFSQQSSQQSSCVYFTNVGNQTSLTFGGINISISPIGSTAHDGVKKIFKGSIDYIETEDTFIAFNFKGVDISGINSNAFGGFVLMYRNNTFIFEGRGGYYCCDEIGVVGLSSVNVTVSHLLKNQIYLTPLLMRDRTISNIYNVTYNSLNTVFNPPRYDTIQIDPLGNCLYTYIGVIPV